MATRRAIVASHAELTVTLEAVSGLPRLDECLLCGVLGEVLLAECAQGDGVDQAPVLAVHRPNPGVLSPAERLYQRGVEHPARHLRPQPPVRRRWRRRPIDVTRVEVGRSGPGDEPELDGGGEVLIVRDDAGGEAVAAGPRAAEGPPNERVPRRRPRRG